MRDPNPEQVSTRQETATATLAKLLSGLDWRTWFGLVLTFAWLTLGFFYIRITVGWNAFTVLPADELGNFLEGAFAPLAFLWLVIGYFIQQRELERNTEALSSQLQQIERSAEQAVIQSEKLAESEVHARQETFLTIAENVRRQLGTTVGLLFISSQSAAADGSVTQEEQSALFSRMGQSDPEVFTRRMLELHLMLSDDASRLALFYGTEVRARHTNNFLFTFERLLARSEAVDPDQMIRDSLYGAGHGLLYQIAKRHQSNAPEELRDPARTGTHINM
jgi:hypothetical protein